MESCSYDQELKKLQLVTESQFHFEFLVMYVQGPKGFLYIINEKQNLLEHYWCEIKDFFIG